MKTLGYEIYYLHAWCLSQGHLNCLQYHYPFINQYIELFPTFYLPAIIGLHITLNSTISVKAIFCRKAIKILECREAPVLHADDLNKLLSGSILHVHVPIE